MIGDRIKELREALGLTQAQIAQDPAFGVKQGTLAAYERNAREPNIETITQLARYFGVTADYLIGMSDHKRPQADDDELASLLSDEALAFLRGCDAELLRTVNAALAADGATQFFEELRSYVLALDDGSGELPDFLLPLADHLSREPGADLKAAQFYKSYKWELISKELETLSKEILAAGSGKKKARGRPKKQQTPDDERGEKPF